MFSLSLYLLTLFLIFCENSELLIPFVKDSELKKETEAKSNANYYIATSGSNSNACTSTASPCFSYYFYFNNKNKNIKTSRYTCWSV
jgi:hypothetical protein